MEYSKGDLVFQKIVLSLSQHKVFLIFLAGEIREFHSAKDKNSPSPASGGFFIKSIFMIEAYDDLEWDIDEMPIGSSTPDEFFELSFNATAKCPQCGNEIAGVANYWSESDDMAGAWLDSVHYEPCENCHEEEFDYEL